MSQYHLNPTRAQLTPPLVLPYIQIHQPYHTTYPTRRTASLPLRKAPGITSSTNSRRIGSLNTRTITQQQRQRPTRLIVVYGYGCDVFSNSLRSRRAVLNTIRKERKKFTSIDVVCNDKQPKSMTRNIARRATTRNSNSLPLTTFVQQVLRHVVQALMTGEQVTLVGHSYGGSVVSRVAIELKKLFGKVPTSSLKAITLGSIFIPSPEKTDGVNIKHYAYDNDIAKLCHKRSKACSFIRFLRPKQGYGGIKSHMNYDGYITAIASTGLTNLNYKT